MDGQVSVAPETPGQRNRFLQEPAPIGFLTQIGAYPWLIVCTTCLGAFAGQVDASIVQLGLPALEQAFDATLDQVSWVAVAYSPPSPLCCPSMPGWLRLPGAS